jgi:hypothetical protein
MKTLLWLRICLIVIVSLIVLGSCTKKAPTVAIDLHESKSRAKCTTREECGSGLNCENGFCAQAYWQDDTDNGDDIWTPGCHWQFTDKACSLNKTFYKGDYCTDETHLEEYTDQKCHTDPDRKSYDCDQECKKIGKIGGKCVTVKDACQKGNDSAKCKCDEITATHTPG